MSALRPLYHGFAWAYDQLVSAPSGPAPDFVAERLRAHGVPAGGSVVDAGCGAGRQAIALAAEGFDVTGLDRSPELLEQAAAAAERAAVAVRFVVADLLSWRPRRPADAVLSRGVLNDLLADDERRGAFHAFARMLSEAGVLLADVREWEASRRRYAEPRVLERTAEGEAGTLGYRSETVADPAASLLRVRERLTLVGGGEQADVAFDFTMRCWSAEELEEHAKAAGFRAVSIEPASERPGAGREDRLLVTAVR